MKTVTTVLLVQCTRLPVTMNSPQVQMQQLNW